MGRPKYVDIIEEEFAKALGAEVAVSRDKLTLFVAHKDRNGADLSAELIATWITKAKVLLAGIGGGATSIDTEGAWMGNRPEPILEPTTMIYTYADPAKIESAAAGLRAFAEGFGLAANQGEVAILLENGDGDWFFKIPFRPGG